MTKSTETHTENMKPTYFLIAGVASAFAVGVMYNGFIGFAFAFASYVVFAAYFKVQDKALPKWCKGFITIDNDQRYSVSHNERHDSSSANEEPISTDPIYSFMDGNAYHRRD